MTVSLGTILIAKDIQALIDKSLEMGGNYEESERMLSRDKTFAIIAAALWAHGSRGGSTAGAYAMMGLYDALDLKSWTFKDEPTAPTE